MFVWDTKQEENRRLQKLSGGEGLSGPMDYSSRPDVYISELYECHILHNSRILTLINIYHILVQLRNYCSDCHDLDAIGSYLVVLIHKLIVLIPQVRQDVFTWELVAVVYPKNEIK